jgi:uncharacterized protein YkwD
MKRRFLSVSLLSFVLFASLASFVSFSSDKLVSDVLAQTNKYRRSNGLPPLVLREELNVIAQKHSADMASGRVGFGHSGFNQRQKQATKKIIGLRSFAENVAFGADTGKEVVAMWRNSTGHRRNMLGDYKYIGIGIAKDKNGRLFYTQIFVD